MKKHVCCVGVTADSPAVLIRCADPMGAGIIRRVTTTHDASRPFLVVLGIAQDGGYPQAGCRQACCERARSVPSLRRHAASVAVIEPATGRRWLIDATPDLPAQLESLQAHAPRTDRSPGLDGIFLTHGHIGHYTGLIHLGKEVMGANAVPVHVMPRMHDFLVSHQPWAGLVERDHVRLRLLADGVPVALGDRLRVTPFLVPHRDELTETVGYEVAGPAASVLFVPDTDDWSEWPDPLERRLARVDVAYVDGTFYDMDELPARDRAAIAHPTIRSTMRKLAHLSAEQRARVRFVHLNHTNPCLELHSIAVQEVHQAGFQLAAEGEIVTL